MLQQEQLRTWRAWIIFVSSVIIGFTTHVLLDEFTHAHSAFSELLPWIWENTLLGLPVYKVLQYSASLVGLFGIAVMLLFNLMRIKREQLVVLTLSSKQKLSFWTLAIIVAMVTTLLKLVLSTSGNTIGILVVAPISGFVLGTVIASLIVTYRAIRMTP